MLRMYKTPTCEKKIVIQTLLNLSGTYNMVYSLILANKIDPPESIFEYWISKLGYIVIYCEQKKKGIILVM